MLEVKLSCYCGQDKSFEDCCKVYISGQKDAPTALDLMRSRYSAYVINDMSYIKKTMLGKALENFSDDSHSSIPKFIKLEIIQSSLNQVEFKAYYIHHQRLSVLHELSDFVFQDQSWFYTNGQLFKTQSQELSLNTPCPCASGKKYKNCHL
jgi:SEC-C motif-containing protein